MAPRYDSDDSDAPKKKKRKVSFDRRALREKDSSIGAILQIGSIRRKAASTRDKIAPLF